MRESDVAFLEEVSSFRPGGTRCGVPAQDHLSIGQLSYRAVQVWQVGARELLCVGKWHWLK